MIHVQEEFDNYRHDKWFWFQAYLELGAAISANPMLSAKTSNFSDLLKDFIEATEELEKYRRGILANGRND